MSLADRIAAAEAELVKKKDSLVEATKALEAAPEEEALLAQVEELSSVVEKATNTVEALKKAEAALAARAKPVDPASPAVIQSYPSMKKHDGSLFVKHAVAKLIAHATKKSVAEVMEERYKDDRAARETFDYVQKTAVNPAETTVAGWAAELVRNDVQGFLEALSTTSVAAALAARSTTLNFGGYNSITIPRRNPLGTALTEPAWVGEGGAIPLTQFSFGSQTINRYKLAAITTFTREIAERSTPAIEGLLRNALLEAHAQVLDGALLSASAAVAGVRPAGLLNGVTGTTASTGTGDAAVIGDIQALLAKFTANRMGARPVLLMNSNARVKLSMMTSPMAEFLFRDEVAAGRLLGFDVVSSLNVPAGNLIMVDADALVTAFDAPMFDVSDVATVVEANADATAPTMAGTDATPGAVLNAGQVPVNSGIKVSGNTGASSTGYTSRSLWQTYSIGIRLVAPTSWALARPNGVEFIANVNWD